MGILPILGLLICELFPTEIRATASGLTRSIGYLAMMANLKLFPMAVNSLGFHYVVYFYAVITALLAAWGFLTIKNTDELNLVEIQKMRKKTEASGRRKYDHPEDEVRKEWNCDRQNGNYSVANAVLNERNSYAHAHEMTELGNVSNVPKRRKSSRVLQLQAEERARKREIYLLSAML